MTTWFKEENELWPGQRFELKIKEVLFKGRTMFQEVLVFASETYGNVLVLDGVIQATERDEFAYQEMISHLPLMSHPNPKRVLVVGGGDGGCVREVLKHPEVEKCDLVEIDKSVIELSKRYLPGMSCSLDDPRVDVHIIDGFEYLKSKLNTYDVIISDSSDPEGPAEVLFQEEFFRLVRGALTDDGIAILMASENIWLKIKELNVLQQRCQNVFGTVKYATTMVPTYTSGQLGLMMCGKSTNAQLMEPCRTFSGDPESLKYYTPEIHKASFVLPQFARKYINN